MPPTTPPTPTPTPPSGHTWLHTLFCVILTAFIAFVAGALAISLFAPTCTKVMAPPPAAPVKQLVKPKKAVVVKAPPATPSLPKRHHSSINNYNIQNVQKDANIKADSPIQPTPPAFSIYNYNIQQTEPATPPTPAPAPTTPPPPAKVPTSNTMVPQPATSVSELVIYNKSFESSQFQQVDSATTPIQMKMVVCSKYQGCLWRWVTIYPPSLAKAAGASFLAVCDDNYGCYKRWVTIFSP